MTESQPPEPKPTEPKPAPVDPAAIDHIAVLRSRAYLSALVLAALLGIPISVAAYGFLALVQKLQEAVFEDLPDSIFTSTTPAWWPLPWLVLCGLLTASV